MSDDEYETTNVVTEKPKRERTEAQKRATAKALEALAVHREAKKREKEAGKATVVKRTTTTTKVVPKSKPRPAPEEAIEEAPAPVRRMPSIPKAPERNYMAEDLEELKTHMRNVVEYVEAKKSKKPAKKVPTINLRPVFDEDSSEEEEEEAPVVQKKKKAMKAPEPTNNYDPQDMLRSIFWRNM
jgi:hypothetical protein